MPSSLQVKDLPIIYEILDSLHGENGIEAIQDDVYLKLCEFLDSKNIQYDFLTALPCFYSTITDLFDSKRIGNAQEVGLQKQIETQEDLIITLKKNVVEAEASGDEALIEYHKKELFDARMSLGNLKKKLKQLTSNSLSENQLSEFSQIYGKHYSQVLLWVNSVSRYNSISTKELWEMDYLEFLKLSNIQQLNQNLEYSAQMKAIAEQEAAAQKNKPRPPTQNRF